ncbi:hypothetical protein, partial [uncultured Oceanicoccus sp.]|uniref:hypothetical protein n=1 Tax=uncultured Oceanicoccus sp. TaxID=1706381 RepID=UPI0030D7A9B2
MMGNNVGDITIGDNRITVTIGNTSFDLSVPGVSDLGIDPSAPNFHNYGDIHILGPTGHFNGVGLLYENLTEQPAPSDFRTNTSGDIKKDGETSKIFLGTVRSYKNAQELSVVNVTLDDHWLDPGIVTRTIREVDGQYVIITMGIGNGALPTLNDLFSGPLWRSEADALARETIYEEANGQYRPDPRQSDDGSEEENDTQSLEEWLKEN